MELWKIQLRPRFLDRRYEKRAFITATKAFLAVAGESLRKGEVLFHVILFFASKTIFLANVV